MFGLFKLGLAAVAAKSFSVGAAFVLNIAVARAMPVTDAGYFLLLYGFVTLASTASRLGLDMICVRETARALADHDLRGALRVKESTLLVAFVIGLFVALAVASGAPRFAAAFWDRQDLAYALTIGAAAVPLLSALNVNALYLQGSSRPIESILLQGAAVPVLLTSLLMFVGSADAPLAANLLLVSVASIFIASLLFQEISLSAVSVSARRMKLMLASGMPLLIAQSAAIGHVWIAEFVLSVTHSAKEVALFYSAERTALLISFALIAVSAVVAPKFSVLYRNRDIVGLELAARTAHRFAIVLGAPIFGVVMLFPGEILGLFGSSYTEASDALRILGCGQLVNVVTGQATQILIMTGNERVVRSSITRAAFLSVALSAVFVPPFGIIGAAASCSTGVAASNILQWLFVRKRLRLTLIGQRTSSRADP